MNIDWRSTRPLIQIVHKMVLNGIEPEGRSLIWWLSREPDFTSTHDHKFGTCYWCGHEARGKTGRKKKWHDECVRAYLAAKGQTDGAYSFTGGGDSFPRGPGGGFMCVECGTESFGQWGYEVDHVLALGLARLGPPREWIHAWHPSNLRVLCHECHGKKTARDRVLMSVRRKGVVFDALTPQPAPSPEYLELIAQ